MAIPTRTEPQETPVVPVLNDEIMAQTVAEDPLARFVAKWWRQIAGVILVIAAGYFAYDLFRSAALTRMRESADAYKRVRNEYAIVIGASTTIRSAADQSKVADVKKNLEDATKRLNDSLQVLADSEAPYRDIAPIYKALSTLAVSPTVDEGVISKIEQDLAPRAWESAAVGAPDREIAELRSLLFARALLDSEVRYADARALLRTLAEKAEIVPAAAANTLSEVSRTDEERAEAKATLEALTERRPELREVLEAELERY